MKTMTRLIAIAFALAALGFAADPPKDDDGRLMKRFIDAYRILEQNAADPFDLDQAFYQGAIPGLLRHLDPHSVFFDPGPVRSAQANGVVHPEGFRHGGIGAARPRGRAADPPNTPSEKAGMTPGDEILAVNNYRLDRLDPDQIVAAC